MEKSEEKRLLKLAVAGDAGAFGELVKSSETKLFSFALSICGGVRQIAEDVYQDALTKAFVGIRRFKAESSFSTWLWTIIKNCYVDFLSAQGRDLLLDDFNGYDPVTTEHGEAALIRKERAENLRELISKLPLTYCEVVTLVDINEMDHTSAAELIGIDKNLLKVRLHRAHTALKRLIENSGKAFK